MALFLWHKPVADAGFREQMYRLGRIRLQLLPQVPHIDPQIVAVFNGVWSPHLAQQLPLGQHFARVVQQRRQQTKLYRRKVHFLASAQHSAGRNIHGNVGEADLGIGMLSGMTAQHVARSDVAGFGSSPIPKGFVR